MINIEMIVSNSDSNIIRALESFENGGKVSTGAVQAACDIGYVKAGKYMALLADAGVISEPIKVEDGENVYIRKLSVTDDELRACIKELKSKFSN